MSSHPNLYVAAVFTRPEGSVFDPGEEVEINGHLFSTILPESEVGIGFEGEEAFAIHIHATYGWCETISQDELNDIVRDLSALAEMYAKEHNLTFVIKLGANYW